MRETHAMSKTNIYIFTTKAAVDLDEAMRTLEVGATRNHRRFLIDLVNCDRQPALLIHFGLKPKTTS